MVFHLSFRFFLVGTTVSKYFSKGGGASVEAIAQQLDAQHQCTQAQQAQKGLGCRSL